MNLGVTGTRHGMGESQCPYCGWKYPFVHGLVPPHNYVVTAVPSVVVSVPEDEAHLEVRPCPGSQQAPRNPESDKRPLWKDGGVK